MKPRLQSFLLCVGLASLTVAGSARAADSDLAKMVNVQSIVFGPAQSPESINGSWDEADIGFSIVPSATQQWVDRVKVTLTVAFTVDGKAKTFHASAEAVALEAGSPHFRFYLPPEVMREYKLQETPNYFAVEVSVGGTKLPVTKKNVSNSISSAPDMASLLAKIIAAGGENNGILVPQYLSPFAHDSSKPAPSFMRSDSVPGGAGAGPN